MEAARVHAVVGGFGSARPENARRDGDVVENAFWWVFYWEVVKISHPQTVGHEDHGRGRIDVSAHPIKEPLDGGCVAVADLPV